MARLTSFATLFFAAAALGATQISGAFAQQSESGHDSHDDSHDSHDDSHDSHDDSHSGHESAFGHAAVYSMEEGLNNIIAIAGGPEDGFAFMLVPTTTANSEGLEEAEEAAEAAWESFANGDEEPTVLATGELATPSETDVYQIALEDPLVLVQVELSDAGALALFLEHGMDEVEVVLTSPSGTVLAAAAEEGGEEAEDEHDSHDEGEDEDEDTSPATGTQWANALIAALVVSACSFAGLVLLISGRVTDNIDLSHACIFGSGALLTASLVHIIPEANEGLQSKYEDDLHDLGLHAGLAVLIGITFGVVVHALLASSHPHSHGHPQPCHDKPKAHVAGETVDSTSTPVSKALVQYPDGATAPVEGGKYSEKASTEQPSQGFASEGGAVSNAVSLHVLMKERSGKALLDIGSLESVCWTVIIGDLVHNFADGVTIGAAFLGCNSNVGWTVTASAVLHEVPHEVADFMALIKGGMSAYQAIVYNFISALSSVAGVILILALRDALTSAQISSILLVGAGSFLFVALSELIPEALEVHPGARVGDRRRVLGSQARKLASFLLGALLIGIPLIFDQHCDAGHDGHNH